jgi:predicted flavoprotein YhiN
MTHYDAAIVGAGPAGLMAAAQAAARGRNTILFDKNPEPGVKILLSGGTRCNLTHATDARGIVEAFGPAGRFLHSALAALGPQDVVDLFEADGVLTKIEAGGKIFPQSDRASDVRASLVRRVRQSGCTLAMSEPITELVRLDAGFRLITPRQSIEAQSVLLAVGGQSYPACGTAGDGYRLAAALGHRIVPPRPALVPVTSHAPWVSSLQGITLPDVVVQVVAQCSRHTPCAEKGKEEEAGPICGKRGGATGGSPARATASTGGQAASGTLGLGERLLATSRGALLFAHFGVTGPAVLDVSHAVSGFAERNSFRFPHETERNELRATLFLRCDLLPHVTENELDAILARDLASAGRRRLATLLDRWLPHRVGETLVGLIGASLEKPVAELSKSDRRQLVQAAKRLDIPVAGTMGFRKAEVTAGGVALEEVDSRTMQSRLVPGLFFAGELLDLHGPLGGYNFQAAFSTGWLAGENL